MHDRDQKGVRRAMTHPYEHMGDPRPFLIVVGIVVAIAACAGALLDRRPPVVPKPTTPCVEQPRAQ